VEVEEVEVVLFMDIHLPILAIGEEAGEPVLN
jgi:hypothetical protein